MVGQFIFISGQSPEDAHGRDVGGEIEAQTGVTLDNLEAVLRAEGSGLERLVKVNVYLANLDDFERFDRAYRERIPEPRPARTTVGAAVDIGLIEIDAIATVG